jgi:ABC-type glycerol-3-phosphate transport system permease component
MPIIGKVGTRSWKGRSLHTSIHLILLLGSITMVYPFLIMISSSFKSNVDATEFSILPKYFHEPIVLYKKFLESRYNENSSFFMDQYKGHIQSFLQVTFPENPNPRVYNDWNQFINTYAGRDSVYNYLVAEHFGKGVYARNERAYRNLMKQENNGELSQFNLKYGAQASSWDEVKIEERDPLFRNFTGEYLGLLKGFERFRMTAPLWQRDYVSVDGNFVNSELIQEFGDNISNLNKKIGTNYSSWDNITLSRRIPNSPLRKYWVHYVRKVLNMHHIGVDNKAVLSYRNYLLGKYGSIELLNTTYNVHYASFNDIVIPTALPRSGAMLVDWIFFIENVVPENALYINSLEFAYRDWLKQKYRTIDNLNQVYYKQLFPSFTQIPMYEKMPEHNISLQNDWLDFVKNRVDEKYLGLLTLSQTAFLDFARTLYPAGDGTLDVKTFNRTYGTNYLKEIDIYPSPTMPANPNYRMDWLVFVKQKAPGQFITVHPDAKAGWQQYLTAKYTTIESLRKDYHIYYSSFEEIPYDCRTIDYFIFTDHQKDIFWEFIKRNYLKVLDLMLYNGRAILNTLIYCLLAIFTALIVNPLAAYAMSRYKMRSTYKILLVLMLTMAFPPMVMGIPNFVMLKKLSLLNTFWALILPAAADGYFIFLLKGFFDSLPKELFESATLDGAGEFRIFWQIAMSLSKPIMAVIALSAFNDAYRNFMFAFIVCQDEKMWTMMVHIYQLMQNSSPGVGYAALVIAAIPTFIVFVFFQNIIIKGIVVPSEK